MIAVGYCYSKEELDRIKNLVADGLTNREIALTLACMHACIDLKLEYETFDTDKK